MDKQRRSYRDAQRVRVSVSYNFGKKTVKGAVYRSLGNEAEKTGWLAVNKPPARATGYGLSTSHARS